MKKEMIEISFSSYNTNTLLKKKTYIKFKKAMVKIGINNGSLRVPYCSYFPVKLKWGIPIVLYFFWWLSTCSEVNKRLDDLVKLL